MHHSQMTLSLIRIIAVIAAGTGLYAALPYFGLDIIGYIISSIWHGYGILGLDVWLILAILLNPVIPVAKIIGAYGLFRFRSWAWLTLFVFLTVDFLIRLAGIINLVIQSYRYQDYEIPEGAVVVGYHSMWPTYIICLLNAAAIFLLFRPSVKSRLHNQSLKHDALEQRAS